MIKVDGFLLAEREWEARYKIFEANNQKPGLNKFEQTYWWVPDREGLARKSMVEAKSKISLDYFENFMYFLREFLEVWIQPEKLENVVEK